VVLVEEGIAERLLAFGMAAVLASVVLLGVEALVAVESEQLVVE